MMSFNVPFLPEAEYVGFLENLGQRLHSVHFSLYDPALSDARVRLKHHSRQTLIEHLEPLQHARKYLLANGRFQSDNAYRNGNSLHRIIEGLEALHKAGVIDGLIFADSYLLTALADTAPELVAQLEAVPSINFGIDNIEKIEVLLDLISSNGFRPPAKITLDRSLNRTPDALASLSRELHRQAPKIQIELLANEGCLGYCPFRSTHEALIAAANAGMGFDTQRLNRDLACIRVLNRAPHRIFRSPFIRPEDMDRYAPSADIIKICGRTIGAEFLKRAIEAYAMDRYQGNLIELLDAAHWMAERWDIPNQNLPDDLFDLLTDNRNLSKTCKTLFECYARPKPLRIMPFI